MSDIDLTYRVMRVPSDFAWDIGEPWVGYDTGPDQKPYDPGIGQAWQLWTDWAPASPVCRTAQQLASELRHKGPAIQGATLPEALAWVRKHAPEGVPA